MTKIQSPATAAELSPGQRTAITARMLLLAGFIFGLEAAWHSSFAHSLLSGGLLGGGGLLLAFAKRAD